MRMRFTIITLLLVSVVGCTYPFFTKATDIAIENSSLYTNFLT